MTLTLYLHPFASYAQKAIVAMYELDLDFEGRSLESAEDWDELENLWPIRKMPLLIDDEAGVTIPESSTVIEYLDGIASGGPKLIPADPAAALQARVWDRFFDNYVAGPMQKIVGDNLRPEGETDPFGVNEARDTLDTAFGVLDAQLADNEWAAGPDFGLADCGAASCLFYIHAIHRWDEDRHPNIKRYYRALMERPSVARVIDEARPYRDLFPMPWPDDIDAT